ncbi:hypothetical protein DYBT9275_05860 [Dyadobacter sp. CECT 9275]|uniref:Aminoglycoside phosphotransferase domain-containing protein n=1 Tax=Dyadobacter helix TaxID=2822344 RepID=A0A916JHU2_9BACT|nr:phosphotransferase [Dyadobacter sp. CECT 9275]CAG5017856.1 hypothetical protein DYBT9275_05860 [Dyadobacter sp. CECT 9275]
MNEREIQILAEKGIYNGKPLCAQLEETHISWILLSDTFAFKIKKPVKLSFLDFSELSVRKTLCEKELNLNKRFSPIYLKVLPVNHGENGYEIGGGHGNPVDYAVMMERLPAEKRMDRQLSAGKVGSNEMIALAETIAQMHRDAPVVYLSFDPWTQIATFNDIAGIRPFILKHSSPGYLEIIDHAIAFSNAFIHQYEGRIRERQRLGFVRDIHGDLHSGNIFISDKPIIFDCIEYNDAFRHIDVLSDIAFLCMDLEAFGHDALSEIFLSVYCDRFPIFQTAADNLIFLYYKCLRANIRAKVNALSAMESEDIAGFQRHLEAAEKYLRVMNDNLLQMQE